jgi:2-phospho-L-lactate/phosphoenolpyruvate guanylyltransferase
VTPPSGATWVVVLIKEFGSAKQRLQPALSPAERQRLAEDNARRALRAARRGDGVLAVCGGPTAAEVATQMEAEVLLEAEPAGQNAAAQRGIAHALSRGAASVLLLSSDLPLVTPGVLEEMLAAGRRLAPPCALAAPATGRGGTNALYLHPPAAVSLHYGDDSLNRFRLDAAQRGATFALHAAPELALDLDEPEDLEELAGKLASDQSRP